MPAGIKLRVTGDVGEAALRRILVGAVVIGSAGNVRVYLACGVTDMRKGFDTLGRPGADDAEVRSA